MAEEKNLYGAPYWDINTYQDYFNITNIGNRKGKLSTFVENNKAYSVYGGAQINSNPVINAIQARIDYAETNDLLDKVIESSKKEAENQLGGSLDDVLPKLNNFLRETEQWIEKWALRVLDGNLTDAQQILNQWRKSNNIEKNMDNISFDDIINQLETLTQSSRKNGDMNVKHILSALTGSSSGAGLQGKEGELIAAVNLFINTSGAAFLNKSIDDVADNIKNTLQGKEGLKPDYIGSVTRRLTVSVKNYKPLTDDNITNQIGKGTIFHDMQIQSAGTLKNFLENLKESLDPALAYTSDDLELFYEYWFNLFYFRTYGHDAASTELGAFETTLEKLLNYYSAVYLMIGTLKGHFVSMSGDTFLERLQKAITDGSTAMFLYVNKQGLIPFSKILERLREAVKNNSTLDAIHFSTGKVNSNVKLVDIQEDGRYIRSAVPDPLNKTFSGSEVARERYNMYAGAGKTALQANIKLRIQLSRFRDLIAL